MTPPRSNAEQFLRTLSVLAWFRSHPDSSLMAACLLYTSPSPRDS